MYESQSPRKIREKNGPRIGKIAHKWDLWPFWGDFSNFVALFSNLARLGQTEFSPFFSDFGRRPEINFRPGQQTRKAFASKDVLDKVLSAPRSQRYSCECECEFFRTRAENLLASFCHQISNKKLRIECLVSHYSAIGDATPPIAR